jgi:hypothetical protein
MRNQLAHESLVILERDDSFVFVPSDWLLELDPFLDQPFDPKTDRAGKDREGSDGNLTAALSAAARIWPGEEREYASRITMLVAEIKMVSSRIVEIYGALYEPEPESAGVEVEIPLWVARDTGDVMNTGGAEAHRTDSCLAFLGTLALVGARAGRSAFTAVTAFVLVWMGRNVFRIRLTGTSTWIAVALFCRRSCTLFLLSLGWHNISNLYPSIEATDMPSAEALM